MRAWVLYILVCLLTLSGVLYAGHTQPEVVNHLIRYVDRFGVTRQGAAERARIAAIMALPIAYEKKQVLVNHTVFMGASPEMVKLAIGDPKHIMQEAASENKSAAELWGYHFPGDTRPTVLRFESGTLIAAYKTSVLDIEQAAQQQ